MKPLVLPMPGNEALADELIEGLGGEGCQMELRAFPDHETYVRIETPVSGRDVILVASIDRPDERMVPLYLVASTLSSLQVRNIVLVAPYLPYMRQDSIFHPGEGLASTYIAHWISGFADALVTVTPHLHRIARLQDIFSIPTEVVQVGGSIAHWIDENVRRPLIVGPDMESRQWSDEVARILECPGIVLHKLRYGDRSVEVSIPDLPAYVDRTPVLVDDIVSTGQTLAMAMRRLRSAGFPQPVCITVHALFGQDTIDLLRTAGAERVVSCNTVRHSSNAIDLSRPIVTATRRILQELDRKPGSAAA